MTTPKMRARLSTAILLCVIATLGFALVREQRKEARLREALALFVGRAHDRFWAHLNRERPLRIWPTFCLKWDKESSLQDVIGQMRAFTNQPKLRALGLWIPIHVDSVGLEEAGHSLSTPVKVPPAPKNDLSIHEL